jgi:peptidoglycan-associated lipoprotein
MKQIQKSLILLAVAALVVGLTGCRKKPVGLTPIPGQKTLPPAGDGVFPPEPGPTGLAGAGGGTDATPGGAAIDATPVGLGTDTAATGENLAGADTSAGTTGEDLTDSVPDNMTDTGIPTSDRPIFDGDWEMDSDFFHSNTVYFDFDRSDVKSSERVKVEEVALYLQRESRNGVLVDGHCDERGTEEYNRALGERRALSVREYLARLGIDSSRIYTRSFGEDMPADPGQNEAAYAKNRRGEFILLIPRKP